MLARLVSNLWDVTIFLPQHPKQLGLQAYATYLNTMCFFNIIAYNFGIIKLGNGVLCSYTMQYFLTRVVLYFYGKSYYNLGRDYIESLDWFGK